MKTFAHAALTLILSIASLPALAGNAMTLLSRPAVWYGPVHERVFKSASGYGVRVVVNENSATGNNDYGVVFFYGDGKNPGVYGSNNFMETSGSIKNGQIDLTAEFVGTVVKITGDANSLSMKTISGTVPLTTYSTSSALPGAFPKEVSVESNEAIPAIFAGNRCEQII